MPNPVLPPALQPGDKVAVVAPASYTSDQESLDRMINRFKTLGFNSVPFPHVLDKFAYLAGTDQARAQDLNAAFQDKETKAIFTTRGGYGATRILPYLDFNLARQNPKIILGYSDITALHIAYYQTTGLITFHGPGGASSGSEYTDHWLLRALTESKPLGLLQPYQDPENPLPSYQLQTLTPGIAEAPLIGGNLSLIAAMVGTPHQLIGKDHILFIEDVKEAPYRIDRMLTQIIQSGTLQGVKGILVGQFSRCDEEAPTSEWKVADVIRDRLAPLNVPTLTGVSVGHVKNQLTLPLGVTARLDATQQTLTLTSPATKK